MDKRKGRKAWDRTPQAQAYRTHYVREHYATIQVNVSKAQGDAYKAACKALGITYSRPLQDVISDVIAGKYKPM